MKKTIRNVKKHFDFAEMQRIAYTLADLEKSSSYDDFEKSSRYCFEKLQLAGFTNVERFIHKADGVSSCFDCVMPQAWSLDKNKRSFLEIAGENIPDCPRILADSAVNPLSANLWSSPTPEGGITAELIDFETIRNGNWSEAEGKWVLYAAPHAFLLEKVYHGLAEAGIAGMVACDTACEVEMPDDIRWHNGNGYCGWYLSKDDKRFPTFSISPRVAGALRNALKQREIVLHGEMNCRVYDGEIFTVTATIPGESSEEIALFAHLYEPFVSDDAAGFANAFEFGAQLIRRKVKLRKTLRLVFSMELYGFAIFLKEHGQNIVLAANYDSVPMLAGADILLRRTPFFASFFTDWLNYDILSKELPEYKIVPETASLSDDVFCPDPYFHGGIPAFWIYNNWDSCHHNTGYLYKPDWAAAKKQFPIWNAIIEILLCCEKFPDYSKRAAKDFLAETRKILADKKLSSYEKKIWIEAEYIRNLGRLESVKRFCGQEVSFDALKNARSGIEKLVSALPEWEMSAAEYRAGQMFVSAGQYGCPFSLGEIPAAERKPVHISRVLWSLLDGKRSLLECIRLADAENGVPTPAGKISRIIAEIEYVAKYGYATVKYEKKSLSRDDFAKALRELGVTKGMKMIVHSTLSSLGKPDCSVEALCEELQDAVGKDGILMMPAFTFDIYLPGKKDAFFDVEASPAVTGILTETFRKMPDVYRSFDPCHSYSVWGKDAVSYIEKQHLYPTVDPQNSPLALLHKADGYVLTISSASSVTFMHVVEDACGAACCGKRSEEFPALLPDGNLVKLRTWGWRSTICKDCPAGKTEEIFALIRKSGKLKEIMLNDAHLMLFSLESYRQAYTKLMHKYCRNAAKPRRVETTVKSDWHNNSLDKNTKAYSGIWIPVTRKGK